MPPCDFCNYFSIYYTQFKSVLLAALLPSNNETHKALYFEEWVSKFLMIFLGRNCELISQQPKVKYAVSSH